MKKPGGSLLEWALMVVLVAAAVVGWMVFLDKLGFQS
jgi:hypothetical protein